MIDSGKLRISEEAGGCRDWGSVGTNSISKHRIPNMLGSTNIGRHMVTNIILNVKFSMTKKCGVVFGYGCFYPYVYKCVPESSNISYFEWGLLV